MTYHFLYNKEWTGWTFIRAHLCTFAINFAFSNVWKVPREGFRYGATSYGVLVTLAMIFVGLPVAFLQLSVGQLSQQDPIGVWRAVPFFKGLGYLRMIISYLASLYTVLYISLSAAYFLSTIGNGIPFPECKYFLPNGYQTALNASECLEETYLASFTLKPEYYIALALMIAVLWIIFPFLLFSPNKFMKRTYYLLGPVVVLLMIIILIYAGDVNNLTNFQNDEWDQLVQPYMWHAAITQALISTQTAGGYMIALGDTVYHNMNVQRIAVAFVATNIVSVWCSLLFWFSVSSESVKYDSPMAVIIQTYETAQSDELATIWPVLTFVMLVCSGIITMVTLLHPLYLRFRRRGGVRWRLLSFASSLLGILLTVVILLEGFSGFLVIEDVVVPFLISVTTMAEVLVFICIYGLKLMIEDIEFLTSSELNKWWSYSLRAVSFVILPVWVWWVVVVAGSGEWKQAPWRPAALVAAAGLAALVLLVVAVAVVLKQYQYDFMAKLLSSFRPSRHWGPRDPITHHYWLARQQLHSREQHSRFGTGGPSPDDEKVSADIGETKFRSNSDDWVYMIYRKEFIQEKIIDFVKKTRRTKSLDLSFIPTATFKAPSRTPVSHDDIISYKSQDSKIETSKA